MAKIFGQNRDVDFAPGNLMSFGKSFSRMGGQPLDESEVWYDYDKLVEFAAGTAAYVGMKVSYVDVENQKVYQYSVQLDGTLKEIGVAPVSDGATIAVDAETGKVSLFGVAGLDSSKTYVPSIVGGKLTWAEPDTSTAEGQQQAIDGLTTRMETAEADITALEDAIGDAESGLVKDIADAKATAETAVSAEATARTEADTALGERIDDTLEAVDAVDDKVDTLTTTVGELDTAYKAADTELARRITALEGTTHFAGTGSKETMEAIEAPKAGDVYIVSSGPVAVGKEFVYDGSEWIELGDVTAEQERIKGVEDRATQLEQDLTALEGVVDGKADEDHGHVIADVEGLQDALDAKEAAGAGAQALADAKAYADELKEAIDEAVQAAQDAADAAQADVDAVPDLIATAKEEAIADADDKLASVKSELNEAIEKNATDITTLGQTVAANKAEADAAVAGEKSARETAVGAVDAKVEQNIADIDALELKVGAPADDTMGATGLFADIADINVALGTKVDTAVATANSGVRFINQSEIDKLKALVIGEGGGVEISGTVNADNVQGLAEAVIDVVTGTGAIDEAISKLAIETGAQVNKLETVKVNGIALNIVDKAVNFDLATLGIVSSDAENKIKINADKSMEVNSINVNRLVQTEDEELVLDGGSAI